MEVRRILHVRGVVQGVGFRPFVYRTALELGLRGAVWNDSDGVVIDVEGEPTAVDALVRQIALDAPPRASVDSLTTSNAVPSGVAAFTIAESEKGVPSRARVSPDLATCEACLRELLDKRDRRFRYPFINCTDCGPRFSIARGVPYDRARTTMSSFVMCARCQAEYDDPCSRRFHAQPNACADCGPRIWISGSRAEPIHAVVAALRAGKIAAIKGLGGFHLACDARNGAAVQALRERKRRSEKPFAVMFADLNQLEREAVLDAPARAALTSARRPIVLVPRRAASSLAAEVSPLLGEIGALLPYTPIHHVLLRELSFPLVMTSGNVSDEPIAIDNDEAITRLSGIADLVLLHDRDIHMRMDDSVARVVNGRERVVRRARGCVPDAIKLDLGFEAPPLLAVGADLKSVFCLASGRSAILSQHLGDLEGWEAQRFFQEARANLERLFRITPTLVAHDLHPGYHSTALALRSGLQTVAVQHHHAHIASCLAENGRLARVIGVAWDGTGHGSDGTAWGGEFVLADFAGFERAAHIRPVPLPGGDAAVRETWRMALSHLMAAGLDTSPVIAPRRKSVEQLVRSGTNCVPTSSAGRLFDAVASLVRLRDTVTYEGQAAMELEAISEDGNAEPYPFPLIDGPLLELDPRPMISAVVADVQRGIKPGAIGARFHATLAAGIANVCVLLRQRTQLDTVALSGGCFHNRRLTEASVGLLERAGFEVLLHSRVPPGDGGIALGQAAVAAWRTRDVSGHPR